MTPISSHGNDSFLLDSQSGQRAHNSHTVRKSAAPADYKEGREPHEILKAADRLRKIEVRPALKLTDRCVLGRALVNGLREQVENGGRVETRT